MTAQQNNPPPMTVMRPYLIRALHQWITDNGQTPMLLVDTSVPQVDVPKHAIKNDRITLNASYNATISMTLGNEYISFGARFGGHPLNVMLPVMAVLGIYSREESAGMMFSGSGFSQQAETSTPPKMSVVETATDEQCNSLDRQLPPAPSATLDPNQPVRKTRPSHLTVVK